ncbi:HalOD1 output domain-containing protein (plasmid) [Haladaptatus sp. SPP-AMP-3]|uniref:HalOD1 output domain-containing protein n=1 Tax=Haladaptatus sp. SPP-AMP-3 TaxID=3121295 RepID=UPI003C2F1E30
MTRASEGNGDNAERGDDVQRTLVHQTRYERDGKHDLTTMIVGAIADTRGISPTDLKDPVLYDCVDIDSLEDAFFGPNISGQSRDGVGTVEFQFGDYQITVNSNGWISVYE